MPDPKMLERRWLISIINKQPQCSDTWEIKKGKVNDISDTFGKLKRKMSGQEFKNRARAGWKIEKGKINKRAFALLEKMRKEEFRKLTKWGVKYAKKMGIKSEEDVVRMIHEGRKRE